MKVNFRHMHTSPPRDAGGQCRVTVIDDAGTRYSVEIMVQGFALVEFRQDTGLLPAYDDILEAMYSAEIDRCLRGGMLKSGVKNLIYFVTADRADVEKNDIVAAKAVEKLTIAAKQIGRLRL